MASIETEVKTMLDLTKAKYVEIAVSEDGKVVWINVDGICRLRVQRFDKLKLTVPSELATIKETGNG